MTDPTIETKLLNEKTRHLELSEYCLVTIDSTVRETVERMREMHRHCAIIVGEHTRLAGLLTERDVLRKVVNHPEIWDASVSSIMTTDPRTIDPDSTTGEALALMDRGRFRNVPVVRGNNVVVGNLTHFAILDYLLAHFPQAVYNQPPDPHSYADQRDGG